MALAYKTPEIKRGDVYYIRYDNSIGSEEGVGRPGVVVSSDRGNGTSPLVSIVFTTTQYRANSVSPELWSTRKKSWALCNQIVTVDKQRVGDKMCSLTFDEMEKIDRALREALDLPIKEASVDVSTYETKIKELEEKIEKQELDQLILQKAYDKVLDRLVDQRIEMDLAKRSVPSAPAKVDIPEPEKPAEEVPSAPAKVDINRCTERDLINLGFSFSVARNITSARPFLKEDDLRIVPGVTRMAYQIAEKRITVGDVSEYLPKPKKKEPAPAAVEVPKTGRVNINTCTAEEIKEIVGCGYDKAYAITGYRKTHGPYNCVDDIINARGMTQKWLDRNRDKLEV